MSSRNGMLLTLVALAMALVAVSPATAGRCGGGGGGSMKFKSTVELQFVDSDDGETTSVAS